MRMCLVAGAIVVAACGGGGQRGSGPGAPAGDRVYVVDESSLVEVDPATGVATVIKQGVNWCGVDARAGVVWFTTDAGLATFDLATRAVAIAVAGDFSNIQPIISWGRERVGGESGLAFAIGLEIAMTAAPVARPVVGCEGDAEIMCNEDSGAMRPEIVETQRRAGTLRLADPAAIAALAARGAGRSLRLAAPAKAVAPSPPVVPKDGCNEMPESCGALDPVPGSGLWLVTTENGRGDYFHETRELWDPATGEYVRAKPDGVHRSKTIPDSHSPDGSTDYGGLQVSRAAMSFRGLVFDAHRVIYAAKEMGATCGWASGGWRVPGPTDLP